MSKNIIISGIELVEVVFCEVNQAWIKYGGEKITCQKEARDYARETYNSLKRVRNRSHGKGI